MVNLKFLPSDAVVGKTITHQTVKTAGSNPTLEMGKTYKVIAPHAGGETAQAAALAAVSTGTYTANNHFTMTKDIDLAGSMTVREVLAKEKLMKSWLSPMQQ